MARHGVAWYWAVLAAIVVGALIGLFTGVLVSVVRIPSFVVTLALFLGLAGRHPADHRPGRHRARPRTT